MKTERRKTKQLKRKTTTENQLSFFGQAKMFQSKKN